MKRLFIVSLLAISAAPARAANPAKIIWGFSLAALAAGASMDISSSYGQVERNPALRSPDGRFGMRGAGIRAGVIGGGAIAQWLIVRKHPQAATPLAGVNIGIGALLGGIAVRNWNVTAPEE